jgi:hypothetical protein
MSTTTTTTSNRSSSSINNNNSHSSNNNHNHNHNVVPHVDYSSRADQRKKELDDLRRRSIAKSKAAKLQDASLPADGSSEILHFLEKQRELFLQQRRQQTDARNYLHQYRATGTALASATTTTGTRTTRTRSTGAEPVDVQSPTYSYYPPTVVSVHHTNNPRPNRPSTANATHAAAAVTQSMSVEDERIIQWMTSRAIAKASEAATIPLPSSFDEDDDDDDDYGCCFYGGYDDDHDDPTGTETSTTASGHDGHHVDIPYESFLRLGASQIIDQPSTLVPSSPSHEQDGTAADNNNNDDEEEENDDDDDDSSVIPSESFMKVGSIMSGGSSTSDDDYHEAPKANPEETTTSPLPDVERSTEEHRQHHSRDDPKATVTVEAMDVSTPMVIADPDDNPAVPTSLMIIHHNDVTTTDTNPQDGNVLPLHNHNEMSALSDDFTTTTPPPPLPPRDQQKLDDDHGMTEGYDAHDGRLRSMDGQVHRLRPSIETDPVVPIVIRDQVETVNSRDNEPNLPPEPSSSVVDDSHHHHHDNVRSSSAPSSVAAAAADDDPLTAHPASERRGGRKKTTKKKKNHKEDRYYPTSSIFVSRHLFSR